jgi:hypothetical protein
LDSPSIAEWRVAVASSWGPKRHMTRLLLLALSVLMQRKGRSYIRATREELAEATGISPRWVSEVALEAQRAGWLIRMRPRGVGTEHRTYKYAPAVPHDRDSEVPVLRGTCAAEARV